jgi:hypothetical protein
LALVVETLLTFSWTGLCKLNMSETEKTNSAF